MQPRRTGEERRHGAHQAGEAADQHRLAAVARVEALDARETVRPEPQARAVALEEGPAEPPAEGEADEVARPGREPNQADQRDHVDLAACGDHAAHDDRGLAGHCEPDEGSRLQEREARHRRIGPDTERARCLLEHAVEVRERKDSDNHHERGRNQGGHKGYRGE